MLISLLTIVSMIAVTAIVFAISYRDRLIEAEKDKSFWHSLAVKRGHQIDRWAAIYGTLDDKLKEG